MFERFLVEDTANPVHDVIDRERVIAMLASGAEVTPAVTRQLHNALGAAIWLGHHERTARVPLAAC